MIILDTSALFAFFCLRDPNHERVSALLSDADGPLIVSPFVVGELDYLVGRRMGQRAELMVLEELGSGNYELPVIGAADLGACLNVLGRYFDHDIGVTDASLVVLADRYGTTRIATLDHRHFSALRCMTGEHFTLLP